MITVRVFLVILVLLGLIFLRTRRKNASLASLDWDALLAQITPLPTAVFSRVDHPATGVTDDGAKLEELWDLIGGADGLQHVYKNSQILLLLAVHAEQWNAEESARATSRIRRHLKVIRHAVIRLSLGLELGLDKNKGPDFVLKAVRSYALIREIVLTLYASTHVARLSQITRVLD